MIGEHKFYFIPALDAEALVIHESHVIGEEFKIEDATINVRFMDGHSVPKFAVADTEEAVKEAWEKFQGYRGFYMETMEKEYNPIQKKIKDKYNELYGEFTNDELADKIRERMNNTGDENVNNG